MRELLVRRDVMICFTTLSCLLTALALTSENPDLGALATCTSWGTVTSFSAAIFLDPTCYRRLRRKRCWSFPMFCVGNLSVHFVPLALVPYSHVHAPWHGLAGAALFYVWALMVSKGTLCLDDVYAGRTPTEWKCLGGIFMYTSLATGLGLFFL